MKQGITYQRTEQINCFQDQLLVADASHSQLLQLLVSDVQQLLPIDLLSLKVFDVLLEAIIEAWLEKPTAQIQSAERKPIKHLCSSQIQKFLGNASVLPCLELLWKTCSENDNLTYIIQHMLLKRKVSITDVIFSILKHFSSNSKPSWRRGKDKAAQRVTL